MANAVMVSALAKSYGGELALDGVSLEVEAGSFTVITGPPKCGKSVLFRLLVGLEEPDSGRMAIAGEDVTGVPPGLRRAGYVPQSFALYPHLSVRDNIGYPLRLARAPAAEIASQVARAAGMLSITHLLDKTPDLLSGGEKQRTALARGLLKDAKVFLLDDPLVGLDYKMRERLMDDLKDLRRELGATFVYATSDSIEALRLASVLVVMDGAGKILQQGDPQAVYARPAHSRALELVGFPRANLLPAACADGTVRAGPFRFDLPGAAGCASVGFRPEAVHLGDAGDAPATGTVRLIEDLGGELVIHVDAGGLALTCACAAGALTPPGLGATVGVSVDPACVHLYAADGAAITAG